MKEQIEKGNNKKQRTTNLLCPKACVLNQLDDDRLTLLFIKKDILSFSSTWSQLSQRTVTGHSLSAGLAVCFLALESLLDSLQAMVILKFMLRKVEKS